MRKPRSRARIARAIARLSSLRASPHPSTGLTSGDLVLAQHRCQPIARAATDGGDEDALSGGVMLGQPLGQRIEDVYVGPPARLRKVHSHVTAGIDDRLPFGRRQKRTEDADGVPRQHRIPGVGIEEQATDRHRSCTAQPRRRIRRRRGSAGPRSIRR